MFSLSITLIIVSSLFPIFRLFSLKEKQEYNEDIFVAAKQVSEYLIGSEFIECDGNYYYESIDHKEMSLLFDEGRLVKKKGYEIILTDVDHAYFEVNDYSVYLNIERNHEKYCFIVHIIQEKNNDE